MYLCGHPGTGKTSSLNQILAKLRRAQSRGKVNEFQLFMYNAMTFTDVRSFALSLLQELTEKKTGEVVQRLSRSSVDDEEVSLLVAQALSGKKPIKNKKGLDSEQLEDLETRQKSHNIVVIDEVDQFNSSEKGFTTLVQTILRSREFSKTNTSIIGIANQVDLPFKKKHSAIAMRDCQLLFEPYSTDQITDILEQKVNSRYSQLPTQMREDGQLKRLFFQLIDDRAYEFIAKKVSKQNGDIRVAFDLLKSALDHLALKVKSTDENSLDIDKVRVTYQTILDVFEKKHGSKIPKTLKSQPRQNLLLLRALSELFEEVGEEKILPYSKIYNAVGMMCRQNSLPRMNYPEFFGCADELENYNFIRIERCKKDIKQSYVGLQVDLNELTSELDKLDQANGMM